MRRRIQFRALVGHLTIGLESQEIVRKADGYKELMAVLGAKLRTDPTDLRRRATPHVHRDIKDPPADAPHQLVLSMGRGLKMKTAQRECRSGERMIVLHEVRRDAALVESRHRIGLGEPTTRVAEATRLDNLRDRHSLLIKKAARPTIALPLFSGGLSASKMGRRVKNATASTGQRRNDMSTCGYVVASLCLGVSSEDRCGRLWGH